MSQSCYSESEVNPYLFIKTCRALISRCNGRHIDKRTDSTSSPLQSSKQLRAASVLSFQALHLSRQCIGRTVHSLQWKSRLACDGSVILSLNNPNIQTLRLRLLKSRL